MRKYKLIELQKISNEKIGSLTEEVEIVTNVKLNSLYIADRKDEIEHYNVGAIIATLELSCPGPVIENPFMLIDDLRIFESDLKPPFTLITGTPIIMRISKERYQKFNIETKYPYAYVYWRKEYPLEMFTRQLEENLRLTDSNTHFAEVSFSHSPKAFFSVSKHTAK
ncbi:MAG: hypothetical protein ACRD5J_09575 [Nitrososphaeraceae archaeon]